MTTSKDLIKIVKDLEQLRAELILEGAAPHVVEGVTDALNELYWTYKNMMYLE